MQQNQDETEVNSKPPNDINEVKQHLISDQNFQQLKNLQSELFQLTEVSPSIRKIINEVINESSLQRFKESFLANWSK